MRALTRTAVWICLAIVALPLSPCAFFSSACCGTEQAAASEVTSAEKPCCAKHSAPVQSSPQETDRDSCQHECCKLSPFVPSAAPVVYDAPLMLATLDFLPEAFSVVSFPGELAREASAVGIPLNILHCQWRN